MKFHTIIASDLVKKGLDLSYPHKTLGKDGMIQSPVINNIKKSIPNNSIEKETKEELIQAITVNSEELSISYSSDEKSEEIKDLLIEEKEEEIKTPSSFKKNLRGRPSKNV